MITQSILRLTLGTCIPCTGKVAMMEIPLDIEHVFSEDGGQYMKLCAESLRNQMMDKIAEWQAAISEGERKLR